MSEHFGHQNDLTTASKLRQVERLRHELHFRQLVVTHKEQISPNMLRIILTGDELEGFYSPGFDDHCKLFIPDSKTGEILFPKMTPDGPLWPDGPRPPTRDYTPHRYDAQNNTLCFDFALHESGIATDWARNAQTGDVIGVAGPRGSMLVPTQFDWHFLAGDATALPAIERRLAELPSSARIMAFIDVPTPQDQQNFAKQPNHTVINWVLNPQFIIQADQSPLLQAIYTAEFLNGDYFAWVGCESSVAKQIRNHLLEKRSANPKWIRASAYWRHSTSQVDKTLD